MGLSQSAKTVPIFLLIAHLSLCNLCLASLYQPPPMALRYNNGALLEGDLPVSILWYGKFSPVQKSTIVDFLLSLNPERDQFTLLHSSAPSVCHWWNTIQTYMKKTGKKETKIVLLKQETDANCSLGKILTKSQVNELAQKVNSKPFSLTLVLTSQNVVVEGFCMSNCGFHGANKEHNSATVWVGNSMSQCPGQCAWPFHQPLYGPQTAPLGSPNGDVGVDGMIVNMASLLAGAVTNPFGGGYVIGSTKAEVGSACTGVYGKGAYPGYAGELLEDPSSGASYNAVGVNGRKYLLPALFDPLTSQCSTLV